MSIDWLAIKTEYINGNISQRKLSEKYGVSFNTLKQKANKEQWAKQKKNQHNKIATKTQQHIEKVIIKKEINKIEKLSDLVDELLIKTEQAISELDKTVVENKQKVKITEYKDKKAPGRPSREIIQEKKDIVEVKTIIDRKGLLNVSASLKNIKDIMEFTGDNIDEEDTDAYFEKAGLIDEENTET